MNPSSSASLPAVPSLVGAAQHSRFFQRLQRRYGDDLGLLPAGEPSLATMALAWEALRARGHDTGTALRILRQLVMARLVPEAKSMTRNL